MGYLRRMSGAQGDRGIVVKQDGFLGGLNLDLPSSKIDSTEVADAENVVFYRTHAEARSGWTPYSASLTTLKQYATFYHKKQKKWITVDTNGDAWVANEAYTSFSFPASTVSGIHSNGRATIAEYGDWAIIFGFDYIYVIELDNSNYLRKLNLPNPEIPLNISSTIGSGTYKYRFIYSYCRYVNGVLVAESGTINTGTIDTNYTEVTFSAPLTENSQITLNMDSNVMDSSWTHVRIYRTLDLSDAGLKVGNNPNAYYLCSLLTRDQFGNYSTTVGIPNMIIGSTFIVAGSFGSESNNIGIDDQTLGSYGLLCRTLDYVPLPTEAFHLGDISPGYMLVANKEQTTYYYSSSGDKERLGYYNPAFQFDEVQSPIVSITATRDSFLILCKQKTYRLSNKQYQDAGDSGIGLTIPQLAPASLMDDALGTVFPNSIEKIDGSRVIALLSDHSVRIWDGTVWGKDWGKFKVETELAKIKHVQGLFDPRGIYFLFYRYNNSAAVATNCLRLGLTEDVGIGWTKYTGSNYIWPLVYNANGYLGKTCVNFTHSDGFARSIVFGDFSTGTGAAWIETYDASGLTRSYTDYNSTAISCMIQFKDCLGSEERFYINHNQTNLYLRPWDRLGSYPTGFNVSIYAYTDENSFVTQSITSSTNYDKDFFFDDSVSGHKVRLKVTFSTGGFKLVGISSIFGVQDRPILRNFTSQEQAYISDLTSDLLFRMGITDPTINMAVGNIPGSEVGSYVSTVGQAVVGSTNASTLTGEATTTTTFSTSTYENASYISFNGVPG